MLFSNKMVMHRLKMNTKKGKKEVLLGFEPRLMEFAKRTRGA